MFAISKILLPVDFSGRSIGAAQYAKALACRFHSELHVVHVVDLRVYGIYGMGNDRSAAFEFAPGCQKEAEHEMDGFLPEELSTLNVSRVLLYGDPAHEIVKYADSEGVGLIVLPTHGHGPFRRFLLGSVTAKVLHDTGCPVWTGAHMQETPKIESVSFRRILCALDPWNGDHSALTWAWEFAQEAGGEVKIVHALPLLYATDSPYFGEDMKGQMASNAKAEIAKVQQLVGSQANVQIVAEEAPAAVSKAARDWKADILVISRGIATGFLGRLRSRSYAIIRNSPCPVVSV